MSQTDVGHSEAGHWLTLADAARFLKVTIRTVDRRGLPKRRPPGLPVEVWVAGATSDDVSDASEGVADDDETFPERALVLSEHVSDLVRQHTAPLLAALAESEARARSLERENGTLSERLVSSQTVFDADRQRLQDERDAQRLRAEQAERELEAKKRSRWKFWETW